MCSELVHASVASSQRYSLSVVPRRVMPPPSLVASEGVAVSAKTIFLSSVVTVVELMVVVVPLTVRSPEIVRLLLNVALPLSVAEPRLSVPVKVFVPLMVCVPVRLTNAPLPAMASTVAANPPDKPLPKPRNQSALSHRLYRSD